MQVTFETINLLLVLAPGIIVYYVFQFYTRRKEPKLHNIVFEILIYCIVMYTISNSIFGGITPLKFNTNQTIILDSANEYTLILLIAASIGLVIGFIFHHDIHMWVLRKLWLSRESSRLSAWHDAFFKKNTNIIIHLSDGRRLFGHPVYFTNADNRQTIYLEDSAWVVENNNGTSQYVDTQVRGTLVRDEEIKLIEFLHI